MPSWAVNCFQRFQNLTYDLTTGVNSDPTIAVHHNAVAVGWGSNNNPGSGPNSSPSPIDLSYVAVIGGIVAASVVVGTLILVKRKRPRVNPNLSK